MARKITYRVRYSNKIADSNQEQPAEQFQKKERIPIDSSVQQEYIDGKVLLINKPLHWTSFDVVRKLRSLLQIKKIGHAGTLDPLATGLLIVCTGKFTKMINEYMAKEKEYTGHFTIGAVTPTYDLESQPVDLKDFSMVTDDLLHASTKKFIGEIEQYPPVYSAIKKDGVPLYELARKGIDVKLEPRRVVINQFEITNAELPVVSFRVICSTGTYIRSLANDFGAALGCGAYLSSLSRTRIGEFMLEDALTMEEIEKKLNPSSNQMSG